MTTYELICTLSVAVGLTTYLCALKLIDEGVEWSLWSNIKQRWTESLTDETLAEQMRKVWSAPVVKVRVTK
jgi:hypothetical protein